MAGRHQSGGWSARVIWLQAKGGEMSKVAAMQVKTKNNYSINSVEHALDLLDAICDEGGEARVSQLSQRLGMNKTSVYRLLATFEKRGFVERGDDAVKYRLGLRAYEMGQKLLSRMGMLRKARPVMERLARQCNEAVYFMVRRGDEILLLDMADSAQQVKIVALTGRRYSLAATTFGRVFQAFGERPAADGKKHLEVKLPLAAAVDELDSLRRRGVCIDEHAFGEGVTGVAVPLLNAKGEVAAVLAILAPAFRMHRERVEAELVPALKDAGQSVSAALGYLGHYLRRKKI
jgi:IclR family transcriptional regulator, KDG regulon repressor